jgi:hypothetical protein
VGVGSFSSVPLLRVWPISVRSLCFRFVFVVVAKCYSCCCLLVNLPARLQYRNVWKALYIKSTTSATVVLLLSTGHRVWPTNIRALFNTQQGLQELVTRDRGLYLWIVGSHRWKELTLPVEAPAFHEVLGKCPCGRTSFDSLD